MSENPGCGRPLERRLDDLLGDPIVALLMRSDGVTAEEVRSLIRCKRREFAAQRPGSPRRMLATQGPAQLAL